VRGSLDFNGQVILAELEATRLTSLKDAFEAKKELVARRPDSPQAFDAYVELLGQATAHQVKPDEVRAWAATAYAKAGAYGPRFQRLISQHVAEALVGQEREVPLALEYARRAERLLEPGDAVSTQIKVLEVLSRALTRAGKEAEVKEVAARLDVLERRADQEYLLQMPPIKVEKFAGRKAKSDRTVLVELFTGAHDPSCVPAELAFAALGRTYKPAEVALLEYHLHHPTSDPLANPAGEARLRYYGATVQGTPTILFDGQAKAGGGGPARVAQTKYQEYRRVIDGLLETPTAVKIKAGAVRKGDQVAITAEVYGLDGQAEGLRLRLALVEERVRYPGRNQVRFHHHVVRAMPGGPDGLALTGKTGKQAVTVDLAELRRDLTKYLDEYAKGRAFPDARRPLELKDLRVVAFVQNDKTHEILQAAQVEVSTAGPDR
jgi:hypothetical protein